MTASLFGGGSSINVNASGSLVPQQFTPTDGQTLFTLTAFSYTQNTNSLLVFINGILQTPGVDYVETSSSSFTLTSAVLALDSVKAIGFPLSTITQVQAAGTAQADIFSGDGVTTQFTLSANPGVQANLVVSISGVTQRPGIDYTWTAGLALNFVTPPPTDVNNILVSYVLGIPVAGSSVVVNNSIINNTPIGQTTPAAGSFTALKATGTITVGSGSASNGQYLAQTSFVSGYFAAGNTAGWPSGIATNPALNIGTTTNNPIIFGTNNIGQATLDTSGNLGLGVAPSAWFSSYKAQQIGSNSSFTTNGDFFAVANNVFVDSGANYKYQQTGFANDYRSNLSGGGHYWACAPSGTAGAALALTTVLSIKKGTALTLEGATSTAGTGIAFPATQVPSADPNTLDDYEEGTWTPTFNYVTLGDLSVAYSQQTGRYVKIGNRVFFSVRVALSTHTYTTSSGALRIAGLPFVPSASSPHTSQATLITPWTKAGIGSITAYTAASDSNLYLVGSGSGLASSGVDPTYFASGVLPDIRISGFYEV